MVIAALIALPLGFFIGHTGRGRQFVIAFTGAMRALPTLGVLFFLLMVFGYFLSYDTAPIVGATIAFVILAIPSMLAGAYSGLESVDRQTIDAARANGMTEWQILTQVEIPLALPLIIGGIRAATLQVIATVDHRVVRRPRRPGPDHHQRHRPQRLRPHPRRCPAGHRPRAGGRRRSSPSSSASPPPRDSPTPAPRHCRRTRTVTTAARA